MIAAHTIAPRVTNRLRTYNAVAGLVHLLQAVAVLSLTNDFSIPVTAPPFLIFALVGEWRHSCSCLPQLIFS
jgi:hypothetical protein